MHPGLEVKGLKRLFQTGAWPFSSDVGKKLTKEYEKTEKNCQILLRPSDQEYLY